MKKTLQIANGIALVFTIVMSYVSNTGVFDGNTMKTVSDSYWNLFTPAGYAFSIWGIIYLGLLGFVLYTGRSLFTKKEENDTIILEVGWWFVISCIGNSLWVVAWLYNYTLVAAIIMFIVLISLIKIIINTRMELDFQPLHRYLLIYWPFAFYSGWISVAFIANISALLTKNNWDGFGISEVTWTIIMIAIVGLLNIAIVLTRNLREFALVGIWALIAIAVSNSDKGSADVVMAAYIVAGIIFITIGYSGFKNREHTISKM